MMDENLVGYLLNALDDDTKGDVERYLASNADARQRLVVLKQALAPLAADRDSLAVPSQLAERTLAKVAKQAKLPQAPSVSPSTLSMGAPRWRRPDVLIAACLLITITGIGLMALAGWRASGSTTVECKNNLRQFYTALQQYRDNNGKFPDVAKQAPRDVAGIVVPILSDAGVLPASASVRCPGVGSPMSCSQTLTALRTMSDAEFAKCSPTLALCYAYSLGYVDQNGNLHGPGDHPPGTWSQTPILADRPPAEGTVQNSINHGGAGQNVLFADGHVKFLPQRTIGAGDDIFTNRNGLVAAGLDPSDIVLGSSGARPR